MYLPGREREEAKKGIISIAPMRPCLWPSMTLPHSLAAAPCLPLPTRTDATDTKLVGTDHYRQDLPLGHSTWLYIKNCSSGQQDFKLQLSNCFLPRRASVHCSEQGRQLNQQHRSTAQAPPKQECPWQVSGFSSPTVRCRTTKHSS